MRLGFRTGHDPGASPRPESFAATRSTWSLTGGSALIARVFLDPPHVTDSTRPADLIERLDRAVVPALDAGMHPFISFKPDTAAALTGRLDPLYRAFAAWTTSLGVPTYATVWHEPGDNAMGAGSVDEHTNHIGRATNFVRIFERFASVVKQINASLQVGPVHSAFHFLDTDPRTAAGAVAAGWRVRAQLKDFDGVDAYASDWSVPKWGPTLAMNPGFTRWRQILDVAWPKVFVVERGITRSPACGGELTQAWALQADYDHLAARGAYGMLYWSSGGGRDTSTYPLGPAARKVFARLAADDAAGRAGIAGPAELHAAYERGRADATASTAAAVTNARRDAYAEMASYANAMAAALKQ